MTNWITWENLTPHPITMVRADGDSITIAPSGRVARVGFQDKCIGNLDGVPVVVRHACAGEDQIIGLPNHKPGMVLLVSAMVVDALAGSTRGDVYAPDTGPEGAIRDQDGRLTGVRRLRGVTVGYGALQQVLGQDRDYVDGRGDHDATGE